MTSQEPRTAAGRALLNELAENPLAGARYAHHVVGLRLAAIEAEAANGSALDPSIIRRIFEEHGLTLVVPTGGTWMPNAWDFIAAEYARLTGSPDPAALADRLVEEGRVSVWGRPGTKFTAKRAKAPDPEATP